MVIEGNKINVDELWSRAYEISTGMLGSEAGWETYFSAKVDAGSCLELPAIRHTPALLGLSVGFGFQPRRFSRCIRHSCSRVNFHEISRADKERYCER